MNAKNRSRMWTAALSGVCLGLACAIAAAAGPGGRGARGPGAGPQSPPPKALYPDIKPVLTAEQLKEVKIENTTIETVTPNADGSIRITAIVTHPPAHD